jgi:PKD repeat protein
VKISGFVGRATAALIVVASCCIANAQEMAMPDATATTMAPMSMPEPLLVTVQALPGYGPAPLLVGFLIHATDPSGAAIVSFNWNFGDGHVSTAPPLLAYNNYARPGNYVATVTVTTADGRSATGFAGVIVKPSAGATTEQRRQNQ